MRYCQECGDEVAFCGGPDGSYHENERRRVAGELDARIIQLPGIRRGRAIDAAVEKFGAGALDVARFVLEEVERGATRIGGWCIDCRQVAQEVEHLGYYHCASCDRSLAHLAIAFDPVRD